MKHDSFTTPILVAFGGNLPSEAGSPVETIHAAIRDLECRYVNNVLLSRFFKTPAFPIGSGPDFVNAAATLEFAGTPQELLSHLHAVEASFGRERRARWVARTLDIDLLAVGESILPDRATQDRWRKLPVEEQQVEMPEDLVLPHPRLQDRGFVLVPLADVAPVWRHPVLGRTVTEMRDALPRDQVSGIVPLSV
ncbi:MAG: 2-amino-4-hydroxy-6-hydroxymethyldihydropteridine diphosphokinase [Pseudomonadota bacterium]